MSNAKENLQTIVGRAQMLLRALDQGFKLNEELGEDVSSFALGLDKIGDLILYGMSNHGIPIHQIAAINQRHVEDTQRQVERGRLIVQQMSKRRLMPEFQSTMPQWGTPVTNMQVAAHGALNIATLGLSQRVTNVLVSQGIGTIGQLIMLTEMQMRRIPSLGNKSINEIIVKLMNLGLFLRKS